MAGITLIGQRWPIAGTGAKDADINLRKNEMGLEEFGDYSAEAVDK